jgi:hypothetical protein
MFIKSPFLLPALCLFYSCEMQLEEGMCQDFQIFTQPIFSIKQYPEHEILNVTSDLYRF